MIELESGILEHLITTPDGIIKIFYDAKSGRRSVYYIDLEGHDNLIGTLKDGIYVWMDGT